MLVRTFFLTLGIGTLLKAWYADGAGPFKCEVSANDNGDLVLAQVIKDVPGTKGRSNAKNKAFPFEVKVPACVAFQCRKSRALMSSTNPPVKNYFKVYAHSDMLKVMK